MQFTKNPLPLTHFEKSYNHIKNINENFFIEDKHKSIKTFFTDMERNIQNPIRASLVKKSIEYFGVEFMLDAAKGDYHRKFILSQLLIHLWSFNKYGRKLFKLETQLAEELSIADCTDIDCSFLKLPVPSICIQIPESLKFGVGFGGVLEYPIKWVYLDELECEEVDPHVREFYKITPGQKILNAIFVSEGKNSMELHEGATALSIVIESGKTIMDQVRNTVEKNIMFNKAITEEEKNEQTLAFTNLYNFIFSIILYINAKSTIKTDYKPRVFSGTSKMDYCSLGEVKLDKVAYVGKSLSQMREMKCLKWYQRGHFRHYYEKDDKIPKSVIWIAPVIKGVERNNPLIPVKPTKYRVEKEMA
jgi:hypothetical protein